MEPQQDRFLLAGPADAPVRFLCAHGAGAGMETPFLKTFAQLLAERGVATLRFEFAYMAARRSGGTRRPPPKAERLMDEYGPRWPPRAIPFRSGFRRRSERPVVYVFGLPGGPLLRVEDVEPLGDNVEHR